MYNESKKWFSQTLLYYEDRTYQTEGKMRVSISTNTSDHKNFNPPLLNISISHNFQKSCNLNIEKATSLSLAFKNIIANQSNINGVEIVRRVSSNVELVFKFKMDQNNQQVVEILLLSNSTDFTKIIIPMNIFMVLGKRIINFVNNYDNFCYKLLMKNIDGEYKEIIKQLPGLIKGISSQIISRNYLEGGERTEEPEVVVPVEQTITELDKFLGTDMSNIDVPELDSTDIKANEKTFNEVNSDFVDKVIDKNLMNLENILVTIDSDKCPVLKFNNDISQLINKDVSYLANLEGDQLKSICYISKLLCTFLTQAHIKFNTIIPSATPILKFKVSDYKEENLEMAYDIFLFIAYMRNIRNRLSDKISDFINNKSRFYLQMRCYLDPFCFSFLEKSDKKTIGTIIRNRFRYYDSIGVFDSYKELLTKNRCPQVTETDIDSFVCEITDKIIGKSNFILDEHDSMVKLNNFRISSSNNFTLEQIINEIIPLEVNEKLGKSNENLASTMNISDEILNYFKSEQSQPKVKKTKITSEKKSNLMRFVNHYRNEIPDQHREKFLEWIDKQSDKNFNFNGEFPYQEFGSNIIKGLYLWKPLDDPKLSKNYKYYFRQFEDCMLEKSHILSLTENKEDTKSDWVGAFDNFEF